MKLCPIKGWNTSEMHVYIRLYMCQNDGLRPLCSLDVFHAACFWGSCEAATSESTTSASFNKQSLPISKSLSQTNSMIKRHTWGEPRGNLPFSLSLCAALFLYSPLSSVFYRFIFVPLFGMGQIFLHCWFNSTESATISYRDRLTPLACHSFPFLTLDPVTFVHFIYCQPHTLSRIFFSPSISLLFCT